MIFYFYCNIFTSVIQRISCVCPGVLHVQFCSRNCWDFWTSWKHLLQLSNPQFIHKDFNVNWQIRLLGFFLSWTYPRKQYFFKQSGVAKSHKPMKKKYYVSNYMLAQWLCCVQWYRLQMNFAETDTERIFGLETTVVNLRISVIIRYRQRERN